MKFGIKKNMMQLQCLVIPRLLCHSTTTLVYCNYVCINMYVVLILVYCNYICINMYVVLTW
jgi:hypothetical protein